MIVLRVKRRELATLQAALYYWQLQGVMSDCGHAHGLAMRAGTPLYQGEIEALADRLELAERGERVAS